jgi:uncharacterized membrane protein YgcG
MHHDDGDEEDLDEQEVERAIKLAKKMVLLPGAWVTVGLLVEIKWSVDKQWYAAEVAMVTEDEITVIYPADAHSGGQMTKDVIPQADCGPQKLRARKVDGKADKTQSRAGKSQSRKGTRGRKGAASAQLRQAKEAAQRSVATRTVPGRQEPQSQPQQQKQEQPQKQQEQQQSQKQPRRSISKSRKSKQRQAVDPNAAFAPLNYDLLVEMLSKLDPQSLAFGAQVCRRLRTACMDNSLWYPILRQTWHWGSIAEARKRSGARSDAALYSATHRKVSTGTRIVLRYPRDGGVRAEASATDAGGEGAAAVRPRASAPKDEPWLLGVVHKPVPGCFLVDWPGYSEDGDAIVDFRNQPMDLLGDRMRLRLSFPAEPPGEGGAGGTDGTDGDRLDPDGDIDDEDVLTEQQVASLSAGTVIRVWEGQWDCGIIRATDVLAHRVTLLGDGDGDSETEGSGDGGAGGPGDDDDAEEEASQNQDGIGGDEEEDYAGEETAAAEVVAAVAAATVVGGIEAGDATDGSKSIAAVGRLLDLALFASRGKMRFADEIRCTGGSAVLSPAQRQRQLAQWQFGLGDLVWARLKPFPPWPAVISCNPKSCAWRRADQYRQVVFFGDYTHRVMSIGDLVAFNRATLQSYSNMGWQSIGSSSGGGGGGGGGSGGGGGRRQSSLDRLRAIAINCAFKFWVPIERRMLQLQAVASTAAEGGVDAGAAAAAAAAGHDRCGEQAF